MSWEQPEEEDARLRSPRRPFDPPVLLILGGLFALIGVGLLAGALGSYTSTRRFVATAARATGTVAEVVRRDPPKAGDGPTYAAIVRFRTARGHEVSFTASPVSNPPAYAVGDSVPVLYDPARPQSASAEGFFSLWGVAVILGSLGAVFAAVGLPLLALHLRGRRARRAREREHDALQDLRQYGRRIDAKVKTVRPDFDEYRVVAQWRDPAANKVYVFESEPIGYDPREFLARTIPVFIDPNDPRRYLVDLAVLPALGNRPDAADDDESTSE
jgi:hypothetical protein